MASGASPRTSGGGALASVLARAFAAPPLRRAGLDSIIRAMSVRPIVMLGDPRLRLKGKPVDSFGKYLHELLDDLAHTMRDAPGVGLAAPQLGEALQACVVEVEDRLHELVNPRIVRSTGDDRDLEGCLSLPGYVAYVTRREKVWVVAQDRHGKKIKVAGSGLLGRALQHELDHLEGKLFIDYLDSMDELMPVSASNEDDAEVREATSALA
jgi:peptide deformylase